MLTYKKCYDDSGTSPDRHHCLSFHTLEIEVTKLEIFYHPCNSITRIFLFFRNFAENLSADTMNLPFFLSRKLSGNTSATGKTGSVIAVLGIALALAVLEVTLAVVTGFRHQILAKLDGFIAPVTISAPIDYYGTKTESFIVPSDTLTAPIHETVRDGVLVPVLSQPAIIKTEDNFVAVVLTGHENEYPAEFERANLVEGNWLSPEESNDIVVSRGAARRLGLSVGDKTTLCFFIDEKIKARPFTISGIYDSGFGDFDEIVAYTSAEALRAVNKLTHGEISRLEIRNIPLSEADSIAAEISSKYAEMLDEPFVVETVNQKGNQYISWLELLDTNVLVIFTLMILVACITLISSLFILVLDKVRDIGILRSLGATDGLIRRIFVGISMKLVIIGLFLGNLIGLGFILTQNRCHYISLDPEMYYLDSVPVEALPWAFFAINIGVALVALAVILIPARYAVRLSPVSTFRFE